MKKSILNIIFLFLLNQFSFADQALQTLTYSIDDETKLTIEGTSNVNSFECQCKDKFNKNKFSYAKLSMKTSKLDCNNARMNKDLCEALKSENYPSIIIELEDAVILSGNFNNEEVILKS